MAPLCSTSLRAMRTQLRSHASRRTFSITRRHGSYDHLEKELTARKMPLLYEDFTPEQSRRLSVILGDIIPTTVPDTRPPPSETAYHLPPAHHLVYTNPVLPAGVLLPDGTDPLQSPGPPFVRRMWAGGSLRAGPEADSLTMDGGKIVCAEGIRDVAVKGKPGEEKVFVGIERRLAKLKGDESEKVLRAKLWSDSADDLSGSALVERRNIVFMRERPASEIAAAVKEAEAAAAGGGGAAPKKASKILRPQHEPDFTHTIPSPDAKLLFRYSALTFNAHAIHLDPEYCRTVEGHRSLLFHGPLSFTVLVTLLGLQRDKTSGKKIKKLCSVEYRNLAPLYTYEPLKLCGKELEPNKYEVWAETPEGGVAVKGTAITTTEEGVLGLRYPD